MLGWNVVFDFVVWFIVMMGFSFFVWRQLRDDYPQDILLVLIWKIVAWMTLSIVVIRFLNGPLLLGGLLMGFLAVFILLRKSKNVIWEWADTCAKYYYWWVILEAVLLWNKWYLGLAIFGMLLGILSSKYYKRIKLYPSGKSGITALIVVWTLAIFEIVIDIFGTSHIYWGGLSAIQWLMVVIICITTALAFLRAEIKIK